MPNDITQYIAIPNGGHANSVGGVLKITPIAPPTPDTGTLPTLPPMTIYDIAEWGLMESFGEMPLAKSGNLGATSSRRTGYAYAFAFDVILDLRRQPELTLRSIAGAEIYFQLGNPHSGMPTNRLGNGELQDRYYWCPVAKLVSVSPAVKPNEHKMVRQHVTGTAATHVLLLPEYGDVTDTSTIAGAYASYLGVQ
jgi:hypothetical protein